MKRKAFTLLEITLCIAILSLVAITVGWQTKNMVTSYHFHKNIDNLLVDLKKAQLIALSDRIDLEMKMTKKESYYCYEIRSDEPSLRIQRKPLKLTAVKQIKVENDPVEELTLQIYSSGRMEPEKKIYLFPNTEGEKGICLDIHKND